MRLCVIDRHPIPSSGFSIDELEPPRTIYASVKAMASDDKTAAILQFRGDSTRSDCLPMYDCVLLCWQFLSKLTLLQLHCPIDLYIGRRCDPAPLSIQPKTLDLGFDYLLVARHCRRPFRSLRLIELSTPPPSPLPRLGDDGILEAIIIVSITD